MLLIYTINMCHCVRIVINFPWVLVLNQIKKISSAVNKADNSNWLANLKTAAMLFVVTVVFVMTFFPAFLMALQIVPHNIIIFYMYFANNVANPVIYSFMNQVSYTCFECYLLLISRLHVTGSIHNVT